jgi:hypothetical protein
VQLGAEEYRHSTFVILANFSNLAVINLIDGQPSVTPACRQGILNSHLRKALMVGRNAN